jgi:hypothetical protein
MSLTMWCTPCLVVSPRRAQSVAWHCAVGSSGTIAVPDEWSTRPVLHCSCTVATSPHVLQALTVLSDRTSCRLMMALTSGVLETCTCVLGTRGPSRTGRPTRLFFMFVTHGTHGTARRMAAQSPPCMEAGTRAVGHAALQSPPHGSGAMVHVVMSEPTLAGRRVLNLLNTW